MSEDIASNIRFAVENSLISSMKHIGKCEFDQGYYPDTEIMSFRLAGSEAINPHHCYGSIFIHEGNQTYCEDSNIYFGCHLDLIQYHSLQETKVNVPRSNGDTVEGYIKKDTPIRYWQSKNCLAITVHFMENDEEMYKLVGLPDYFSNTTQQMLSGLLSVNPNIKQQPLTITIKKGHGFFEIEQQIWKNKMQDHLDNIEMKYSFVS